MKKHIWNDLFSFENVVRAGSFTRAAEELGLSPSVLSKRITRLEKTFNLTLLKRNTRKLFVTAAGRQCYEEVIRLRNEFEQILKTVGRSQQTPSGKLRISAPFSFGQLHLAPVLFEFLTLYPDIQIELLLGQPSTRLIEKNIDVGIFIKEVPDARLIAKCIGKRDIVFCGSPNYFKQNGTPQTPEELSQHNCLLYHASHLKNRWRFQHEGKKVTIEVTGNFVANSTQILAQAAIAGKGIIKSPGYLVKSMIAEKKLIRILEDYSPPALGIYAAYPSTRHPALTVKTLIDFLMKKFSQEENSVVV